MPKMKTRKAAAKRFQKTASGKISRGRAFHKHILEWKTSNSKRKMRKKALVSKSDLKRVKSMLPGF